MAEIEKDRPIPEPAQNAIPEAANPQVDEASTKALANDIFNQITAPKPNSAQPSGQASPPKPELAEKTTNVAFEQLGFFKRFIMKRVFNGKYTDKPMSSTTKAIVKEFLEKTLASANYGETLATYKDAKGKPIDPNDPKNAAALALARKKLAESSARRVISDKAMLANIINVEHLLAQLGPNNIANLKQESPGLAARLDRYTENMDAHQQPEREAIKKELALMEDHKRFMSQAQKMDKKVVLQEARERMNTLNQPDPAGVREVNESFTEVRRIQHQQLDGLILSLSEPRARRSSSISDEFMDYDTWEAAQLQKQEQEREERERGY